MRERRRGRTRGGRYGVLLFTACRLHCLRLHRQCCGSEAIDVLLSNDHVDARTGPMMHYVVSDDGEEDRESCCESVLGSLASESVGGGIG